MRGKGGIFELCRNKVLRGPTYGVEVLHSVIVVQLASVPPAVASGSSPNQSPFINKIKSNQNQAKIKQKSNQNPN